jgi:hypothetical protein
MEILVRQKSVDGGFVGKHRKKGNLTVLSFGWWLRLDSEFPVIDFN